MKKVILLMIIALQLALPVMADQAYGRFGRFHEDGLLTTNVHPRGFTILGTNPELNIRWGDPKAALSAVVSSINPTEKILAIEGGGAGAPSSIRYTLVYPGFSATFGKQLVLRFSNHAGKAVRVGLDPTRLKQGWLLVIPGDRYPAVPLLIKVPRTPGTKAWFTGDGLTVESPVPLGEVIFTTPTGMRPIGSLNAAWKSVSSWGDAPIPVLQAISNAATETEISTTHTWNTPYAPISPLLALALQAGFPAQINGPLVRTEIRTRYGPYSYIAAKSSRMSMPRLSAPLRALYGERLSIPAGRLMAEVPTMPPAATVWNLYPWLQSSERVTPAVRTNLIRTYRVRRAKAVFVDSSEPITGVHLQLPKSGLEKGKRDLDDVVSLARLVLSDYAFADHIGDVANDTNLKTSVQALAAAVQVRTDWLWGCVGRSDDGFQSLDLRETGDVAAALCIASRNPGGVLTPGEVEDVSAALMSHCWSAFSRDSVKAFGTAVSIISNVSNSRRLDENDTFEVGAIRGSNTSVSDNDRLFSDAVSDVLLEPYVNKTLDKVAGNLRAGCDIGLVFADGLRITGVLDTSIRDLNISISSGVGRIRVLKLATSSLWTGATARLNGSPLVSMQIGDELHILLPPFAGTAKLQLQARNIARQGFVFLDPLFGMMDWQNDMSVIGPGSSR